MKKSENIPPESVTASSRKEAGRIFIISAPSGAGKTTLCKAILNAFTDMRYSISHTTRKPRSGERHGVDYFFVDTQVFRDKIENDTWAEWAEVYDHYYGTCSEFLDRNLLEGNDILLDIDTQGARQILQRYPDSVTIFIVPPSLETLRQRLEARATDNQDEITKRLRCAEKEMAQKAFYQHVVVNDDLSKAVEELLALVKKYR